MEKSAMQELISKWDEIVSNTHGVGGKPQEFYNKQFMRWFMKNMDSLIAKEREQSSEHAKEVSVEFNLWINYSETGKKFMWDHFYSSKPVYSILSEAYDIFAKEVGL